MKKILLFFVCLLMTSMAAFALPNSSVLLQHKGNVTVYQLEEFETALADAVDGDTLFLSKGTYPAFTIDKKITVRGEGQETIVGDVIVDLPGNVTLESTLLEGLRFVTANYVGHRSISVAQSVDGLKIKQCYFDGIGFKGKFTNVKIDRSYCVGVLDIPSDRTDSIASMVVTNSMILYLLPHYETSPNISLVNCNIGYISSSKNSSCSAYLFKGSLINSILSTGYYYDKYSFGGPDFNGQFSSAVIINSLINECGMDGKTYKENVYKENNAEMRGKLTYYTTDELLERGYIGNDGTVVGCFGGSTPYTLTLAVPVVEQVDVKLDADQRKLNVNLKLGTK